MLQRLPSGITHKFPKQLGCRGSGGFVRGPVESDHYRLAGVASKNLEKNMLFLAHEARKPKNTQAFGHRRAVRYPKT